VFVLQTKGVTQMTTLEDLYFGNINPNERDTKRGSKMDQLVKLMCKNEDRLNATLTEQQKETFEKYKDAQRELSLLSERDAFRTGFIIATRIMVEVMEGLQVVEDL